MEDKIIEPSLALVSDFINFSNMLFEFSFFMQDTYNFIKIMWTITFFIQKLNAELPDSVLLQIPDCGHIPHIEKPESLTKFILDFIWSAFFLGFVVCLINVWMDICSISYAYIASFLNCKKIFYT